jgi:DNA-binding CsgD family transcriptional regulator
VFAGSFSLSAAEAVAGNAPIVFEPSFYLAGIAPLPPDDNQLDWTAVFELLDGLVDHSLVQRVETGDAEPRFRLFQSIRHLAIEKLAARGDDGRAALRHATWYRALAETTWRHDGVAKLERLWLEAIDTDYENLRTALDYLSEHDPAVASTMAAALVWYFYIRGRRMEGIRAIERTAGRFDPEEISAEARARTEFAYGSLLSLFPQTRQAGVQHLESVLDKLIALGHAWGAGYTYMALGVLAEDEGQYARALEYVALARPLLEVVNDKPTIANVDFHTGVANFGLGNLAEARALATRVAEAQPGDAGLNVAYALHLLGLIAIVEGNRLEAAQRLRESLDFSLQHGVVATASELIDATATLLAQSGDLEQVARLFGAADRLNREAGNPITLPEKAFYDAAREQARSELGAARFHELLANGATLSLDAALAQTRQLLVAIESEGARLPEPHFPTPPAQPFGQTPRELEVLRLVSLGMSDREIGDRLFISHGTARTHVRNILTKLDTRSRTGATSIALREGLVDLSETD